MSDDGYDDELPAISVNCSRDSIEINMPAAAAVAAERAKTAEVERQLAALRAGDVDAQSACSASSSEEITAAINSLLVKSPQKESGPSFEKLLHSLSEQLTDKTFILEYLDVLQDTDEIQAKRLYHEMLSNLWSISTCTENTWTEQDILSVCVWLCCACVCQTGVLAPRLLQHLMFNVASDKQAHQICRIIQSANWDAPLLFTLNSALYAGCAGINSSTMETETPISEENNVYADTLLRAAAAKILKIQLTDVAPLSLPELTDWCTSSFRKIKSDAQYMMIQLAGAALARKCRKAEVKQERNSEEMTGSQELSEVGLFLRALNVAPSNSAHSPEYLRVAVGVSKLQLMFRSSTYV